MNIEDEINFEVAISILNNMIGRTSLEKLAEQKKKHPDQNLITRLDAKINQFWDERSNLHYGNHAEIERVLIEYSSVLNNALSGTTNSCRHP